MLTDHISGKKMIVKKVLNGGSKVTARADSTGLENDLNQIVKHHHSVKKMQTPSVRKTFQNYNPKMESFTAMSCKMQFLL